MTQNSIAVLPFLNLSTNAEFEHFGDSITEEIINALSKIDCLHVTSRTSSFFFKEKNFPIREVAEILDVSIILEGSIKIAGDMVRVTAQLIQAKEDFHFWSESWDRKISDFFGIQDEISLHIAEKLREQFGHFEISQQLSSTPTASMNVYGYYTRAKNLFYQWNPDDVMLAISYYHKALDLDTAHVDSLIGLAEAYGFLAIGQFMPHEKSWPKVVEYTHKALELSPENPAILYHLGRLSLYTECNYPAAIANTNRALALNPSFTEAHRFMAFLLMLGGHMDKAYHHLQLALTIDPLNQETLFYKGLYLYRKGELKNAIEQLEGCLEKNPKNMLAFVIRSYCMLKLGQFDTLQHLLESPDATLLNPDEKLGIECLAYLLSGNVKKQVALLEKLRQASLNPMAFHANSYQFMVSVLRKHFDEAFDCLDQVTAYKSYFLLLSFTDPLVSDLTHDKRYDEYRKRLFPKTESHSHAIKKVPLLDSQAAEEFANKLLTCMETEEVFLDPNLTLRSLAEKLDFHPNHLSWLLNEKMGNNFNEFVNQYRIRYFKKLATSPSNAHISMLGLAFASGFKSKTVFNTTFKKVEGMTPSDFLKIQDQSN